jgi:hypothetical protein
LLDELHQNGSHIDALRRGCALKALCKLTSTLMFTLFTPVSSFFLIGLTSFPGDEFMRV